MLALQIMGAFSTRVTPAAVAFTMFRRVAFASISTNFDVNMLYAAAQSFTYSIISLLVASQFTAAKPLAEIGGQLKRSVTRSPK